MNKKILIVDDEWGDPGSFPSGLGTVLEGFGFEARGCTTAAEAPNIAKQWFPDYVMIDGELRRDDGDGGTATRELVELLQELGIRFARMTGNTEKLQRTQPDMLGEHLHLKFSFVELAKWVQAQLGPPLRQP